MEEERSTLASTEIGKGNGGFDAVLLVVGEWGWKRENDGER